VDKDYIVKICPIPWSREVVFKIGHDDGTKIKDDFEVSVKFIDRGIGGSEDFVAALEAVLKFIEINPRHFLRSPMPLIKIDNAVSERMEEEIRKN